LKKRAGFLGISLFFGDKCQMLAQEPPLLSQLTQAIIVNESPDDPSFSVNTCLSGECPSTKASPSQVSGNPKCTHLSSEQSAYLEISPTEQTEFWKYLTYLTSQLLL